LVVAAESARNEAQTARAEAIAAKNLAVSVSNGVSASVPTVVNNAAAAAASASSAAASAASALSSRNSAESRAAASLVNANAAADSAAAAQLSAENAALAETAAYSSIEQAQNSATASQNSAVASTGSASTALGHRNAAQASATAAASSASLSLTYSNDAQLSAQNAAESAVEAEASAQAAEAAANNITANSVRFDIAQTLTTGEKAQVKDNLGLGSAAFFNDSEFATANHTHTIANVTDLQAALDGKAATSHTHTAGQITDFNTAADARVNALVPAASTTTAGKVELATVQESLVGTATNVVTDVFDAIVAQLSTQTYTIPPVTMSASTSGAGANTASSTSNHVGRLIAPNAATTGFATRGASFYWHSNSALGMNHSTAKGCAFKLYSGAWGSTFTDVVIRGVFGKIGATIPAAGALANRGFSWTWNWGTRQLSIQAHDGTNLTSKNVTWNPTSFRAYELAMISNGSGTVSLYIDGVFVDSTTGGPTGNQLTNISWYQIEIENTSTSSPANTDFFFTNPKAIAIHG